MNSIRLMVLAGAMAPCISASEAVAYTVRTNGIIALHDTQGICSGEAMLAVFTDGVRRIPGCWTASTTSITIAFTDGGVVTVPFSLWKRADDV